MISDALSLYEFLKKHWKKYSVISALFDADGERIEGDQKIFVTKQIVGGRNDQWFYRIKEIDEYTFIYMPVIPLVYADYGLEQGETNADARIFRFVGNPLSTVTSGGAKNVRVNFIVVGYKAKDLLNIKESS
ncbi:hypothetical protein KKB10_03050 [Patescibacteria group bacterium]|nr:hypothetical protein [Patescibacteria group bacterium]MBU1951850.1 hypothetical protein [Patescibacteria group bacterium]